MWSPVQVTPCVMFLNVLYLVPLASISVRVARQIRPICWLLPPSWLLWFSHPIKLLFEKLLVESMSNHFIGLWCHKLNCSGKWYRYALKLIRSSEKNCTNLVYSVRHGKDQQWSNTQNKTRNFAKTAQKLLKSDSCCTSETQYGKWTLSYCPSPMSIVQVRWFGDIFDLRVSDYSHVNTCSVTQKTGQRN